MHWIRGLMSLSVLTVISALVKNTIEFHLLPAEHSQRILSPPCRTFPRNPFSSLRKHCQRIPSPPCGTFPKNLFSSLPNISKETPLLPAEREGLVCSPATLPPPLLASTRPAPVGAAGRAVPQEHVSENLKLVRFWLRILRYT